MELRMIFHIGSLRILGEAPGVTMAISRCCLERICAVRIHLTQILKE